MAAMTSEGISAALPGQLHLENMLVAEAASPAIGATESSSYLRTQSAGSILRGTFKLYRRHFGTLVLMYVLPVAPAMAVYVYALASEPSAPNVLGGLLLVLAATLFAMAATTVAVSDVCLGQRPGVFRSYRRIAGATAVQIFLTTLLLYLAFIVGFVLLIVPAIVLLVRCMFAFTVVVLEGKWGLKALKRSGSLGRGYHWRNAGIVALLMGIGVVVALIVAVAVGILAAMGVGPSWLGQAMNVLAELVAAPLGIISGILIYYDLRVRKEAYDVRALGEDLRR
jgi:hypothetical protein